MAKNKLAKITMAATPTPSREDMQYRARDALHTISRAEEHRKDKELMREVKKMAKQQHKAVCK